MLFILPGSLHLRSFPCLELSIIKTKIIIVPEAYDILVLLHISSLSVRHRERCLLHTSMTNINISYKYSNASHTSLWLDFFFTCCKENWENTKTGHRYTILTCSLSIKVSCEPSRSQISLFPLSHYLPPPNHITCKSCSENREISSEMVPPSQKSHYSGMIPSAAAQVLFF